MRCFIENKQYFHIISIKKILIYLKERKKKKRKERKWIYVEYLLCVPFKHSESHPATDVKQPDQRVLTTGHKQLSI